MSPNLVTHFLGQKTFVTPSKTGVVDYFNSPQIVTPPVIINQGKMTPPSHNKIENSNSPQVIMTPLISIANQWRNNING